VVVATADGGDTTAGVQLGLPEGRAEQRAFRAAALGALRAAIGDLDRLHLVIVRVRNGPSATHALLARRGGGVVDREHPAGRRDGALHRADVGHAGVAQPEVDEGRGAEDVGVALEGGDLTARDQQKLIKGRLQLGHGLVVAGGVVVGDGDEIQAPGLGGFHRAIDRARNPGARLGQT